MSLVVGQNELSRDIEDGGFFRITSHCSIVVSKVISVFQNYEFNFVPTHPLFRCRGSRNDVRSLLSAVRVVAF
jgi:hypothetical protein